MNECKGIFDPERQVIVAELHGEIRNADVVGFIELLIATTQNTKCHKWLIDYNDAAFKLNTAEIYDLPRVISARMDQLDNHKSLVRRAVVSGKHDVDLKFLEDVAVNQGQNLRLFSTEADALRWLLQ